MHALNISVTSSAACEETMPHESESITCSAASKASLVDLACFSMPFDELEVVILPNSNLGNMMYSTPFFSMTFAAPRAMQASSLADPPTRTSASSRRTPGNHMA